MAIEPKIFAINVGTLFGSKSEDIKTFVLKNVWFDLVGTLKHLKAGRQKNCVTYIT